MISLLQNVARNTAQKIGRESLVIRTMRPAYETLLEACTAGKGVPWAINGVTYRVNPRERSRFDPDYDAPIAALFQQRVKPGAVCLDVGANAGVYVLQLAYWSRPNGRVIAFEPNPQARKILEEHIRLNDISNRVEIVPYAVGAGDGEATLFAAEANGMSRLAEPNRALAGQTEPIPVKVSSLDTYCEQFQICPDVLLLDIEGFEIAALSGASRLIRRRGKDLLIVVEMHPGVWESAGTTRMSAEHLLGELGLQAVPLTGQVDALGEYGQVLFQHD